MRDKRHCHYQPEGNPEALLLLNLDLPGLKIVWPYQDRKKKPPGGTYGTISWAAENGPGGVADPQLWQKDFNPDTSKYSQAPLFLAAENGYSKLAGAAIGPASQRIQQLDTFDYLVS